MTLQVRGLCSIQVLTTWQRWLFILTITVPMLLVMLLPPVTRPPNVEDWLLSVAAVVTRTVWTADPAAPSKLLHACLIGLGFFAFGSIAVVTIYVGVVSFAERHPPPRPKGLDLSEARSSIRAWAERRRQQTQGSVSFATADAGALSPTDQPGALSPTPEAVVGSPREAAPTDRRPAD